MEDCVPLPPAALALAPTAGEAVESGETEGCKLGVESAVAEAQWEKRPEMEAAAVTLAALEAVGRVPVALAAPPVPVALGEEERLPPALLPEGKGVRLPGALLALGAGADGVGAAGLGEEDCVPAAARLCVGAAPVGVEVRVSSWGVEVGVGLLPPPPPPLPAVGVAGRGERERHAEAVEVGTAGVPVAPAAVRLGEELLPLLPVAAAAVAVAGAEAEAAVAGEGLPAPADTEAEAEAVGAAGLPLPAALPLPALLPLAASTPVSVGVRVPPAPGLPVAAAGAKEAVALNEREGVLVEVRLAPALPLTPPLLPVGFCPVAVGVRVGCRTVALGVLCPREALPPVRALAAPTGERLPPPVPPLAVGRAPLPEGVRVAAGTEGVTLGLTSRGDALAAGALVCVSLGSEGLCAS